VTLHRPDEGPGEEADLAEEVLSLGPVDRGQCLRGLLHEFRTVPLGLVPVPRRGHAVEVACVVDVESPEFARLVPPAVRGVGAED